MTKRADIINPRVSRKVLPAVDLYTHNVELNIPVKKLVYCEYHRKMEWIADFYLESESKAKNSDHVRKMCIEGWDLTEGKLYSSDVVTRTKEKSTASLIDFLE